MQKTTIEVSYRVRLRKFVAEWARDRRGIESITLNIRNIGRAGDAVFVERVDEFAMLIAGGLVRLGGGPTVTAMLGDRRFPQTDGIRNAIALVAPGGYVVGAARLFGAAWLARGHSTSPAPAG